MQKKERKETGNPPKFSLALFPHWEGLGHGFKYPILIYKKLFKSQVNLKKNNEKRIEKREG
jgi:hypothetical protein